MLTTDVFFSGNCFGENMGHQHELALFMFFLSQRPSGVEDNFWINPWPSKRTGCVSFGNIYIYIQYTFYVVIISYGVSYRFPIIIQKRGNRKSHVVLQASVFAGGFKGLMANDEEDHQLITYTQNRKVAELRHITSPLARTRNRTGWSFSERPWAPG